VPAVKPRGAELHARGVRRRDGEIKKLRLAVDAADLYYLGVGAAIRPDDICDVRHPKCCLRLADGSAADWSEYAFQCIPESVSPPSPPVVQIGRIERPRPQLLDLLRHVGERTSGNSARAA